MNLQSRIGGNQVQMRVDMDIAKRIDSRLDHVCGKSNEPGIRRSLFGYLWILLPFDHDPGSVDVISFLQTQI